jgi:hypothetical protein
MLPLLPNPLLDPFTSCKSPIALASIASICATLALYALCPTLWRALYPPLRQGASIRVCATIDSFFNCFPPKNWPSWGASCADPSRPTNKSRANSANDRMVAVQSC